MNKQPCRFLPFLALCFMLLSSTLSVQSAQEQPDDSGTVLGFVKSAGIAFSVSSCAAAISELSYVYGYNTLVPTLVLETIVTVGALLYGRFDIGLGTIVGGIPGTFAGVGIKALATKKEG